MVNKSSNFSKINPNVPKWSNFFRAGDAWLQSLEVLKKNIEKIGWGVFYVTPFIIAFCLELFVKAIASHEDNSFNEKAYSHNTDKILKSYSEKISLFKTICKNKKLMLLIKEYQKTIDTKFGETYVSTSGVDQSLIIDTIYELRSEICGRTGLK